MMGIGNAFNAQMSPEFCDIISDDEESAKKLKEMMIQKQLAKLPPIKGLPKELKDAIEKVILSMKI